MISYQKPDSKYFDYSYFPKKFESEAEAIDAYNELGYPFKLQFHISRPRQAGTFTLECPFSKICPVRAKFNWNSEHKKFIRQPHIQIYHDHCVQLRELSPEIDKC